MIVYTPRNPFTSLMPHDENLFDIQMILSEQKAMESFRFWLIDKENDDSDISVYREAVGISEHLFSEHRLWVCYDVRTLDLIGLRISTNGDNLEALDFLEEILSKCLNVPMIITNNQIYFDWAIAKLNLHSTIVKNKSKVESICKN